MRYGLGTTGGSMADDDVADAVIESSSLTDTTLEKKEMLYGGLNEGEKDSNK